MLLPLFAKQEEFTEMGKRLKTVAKEKLLPVKFLHWTKQVPECPIFSLCFLRLAGEVSTSNRSDREKRRCEARNGKGSIQFAQPRDEQVVRGWTEMVISLYTD